MLTQKPDLAMLILILNNHSKYRKHESSFLTFTDLDLFYLAPLPNITALAVFKKM